MEKSLSENVKKILANMRRLGITKVEETIPTRSYVRLFDSGNDAADAAQELIDVGIVTLTASNSLKLLQDLA